MRGYHVVRIAVDGQGRPISGTTECVEHRLCHRSVVEDVGPFDTVEEVLGRLVRRLDKQLDLWDNSN